ncbi:hypothetical protein D9613_006452 [Agrocybe pediades]|uniref:Uncharacterized protein n=1 Tax=Agrocybe pediades TaxID=84607 RepID=A0A8H4QHP2_9AGAR|nr:hypothetical protein D9613_006452 [Agrocybe pediades]
MPSHTVSSALIKMFYAQEGAPWIFPVFQDITGVRHGLFPSDDALLPQPWTRATANDIQSYFQQYQNQRQEDDKIKFSATKRKAGTETVPGRPLWNDWVTSRYGKLWNIHTRISSLLSQHNLHPIQIMVANNLEKLPSNSSTYLFAVIDPIARDLLGEEALDSNGRLLHALRDPLSVLLQRQWENLKKQATRSKNRLEKYEAAAEKAFETLNREKLTKGNVNSVIRAVSQWKNLAEIFGTDEVLNKIKDMETELELLLEGLGGKVTVSRKAGTKALVKVSQHDLSALAKEEDIADILDCYEAFFSVKDDLPPPSGDFVDIKFGEKSNGSDPDPGVDEEANLTLGEVLINLGFGDKALPFNFNDYRHIGGLTPWDFETQEERAKFASGQGIEKFSLRYHQIAGVHAVIRKVFSEKPVPDHCGGMLVADEVGLGKTLEACTIIAFLCDLGVKQAKKLAIPPIIEKYPYLHGSSVVPSLPHLIVVPGTLISQWHHELKAAFQPGYVDILLYGQGLEQHEFFWSEQGLYQKTNHPPHCRIILASHSDFSTLYLSERGSRDLPWAHPARAPGYDQKIVKTLYSQRYLSVTFDEAQAVRNYGPRHSSALRLLEQAEVRLILTATPLQTSTKDIAAMGRLVGIPYFSSKDAYEAQQLDAAELRRAKTEKARIAQSDEDGALSEDFDPVKLRQVESAARMHMQFQGRLLRRTADSLGIDGDPLVKLENCNVFHGVVKLTKREMDIIQSVTEINLDVASTANGVNITTRSFYLEHRLNVAYASEDSISNIPYFRTLEEWKPLKSTKIDTCCRMVVHLLTQDDAPDITFKDGAAQFPPFQRTETASRDAKVVIYQEFPSFSKLLLNILKLYGVDAQAIHGRTPYDKRFEVLSSFMKDPTKRVLIISQIGSVGLNITCARYLIFLDQLWSHQEEHQIIGRIYRQGQTHRVVCYHILAENTADIVLARLAHGKLQMLEAFLSTDKASELKSVLSGGMVDEKDDDEEEKMPNNPKKKKERRKSKGKCQPVVLEDDEPVSGEAMPGKDVERGNEEGKEIASSLSIAMHSAGAPSKAREISGTASSAALEDVMDISDGDTLSLAATTPYSNASAASSRMDISADLSDDIESPDSSEPQKGGKKGLGKINFFSKVLARVGPKKAEERKRPRSPAGDADAVLERIRSLTEEDREAIMQMLSESQGSSQKKLRISAVEKPKTSASSSSTSDVSVSSQAFKEQKALPAATASWKAAALLRPTPGSAVHNSATAPSSQRPAPNAVAGPSRRNAPNAVAGPSSIASSSTQRHREQPKPPTSPDDQRAATVLQDYRVRGTTSAKTIHEMLLKEHQLNLSERTIYRRRQELGLKWRPLL